MHFSTSRQVKREIPEATRMFSVFSNPVYAIRIIKDQTGSRKFKMAATECRTKFNTPYYICKGIGQNSSTTKTPLRCLNETQSKLTVTQSGDGFPN